MSRTIYTNMIKQICKCAVLTGVLLGAIAMASADTHVTFQVDMTAQTGSVFNPGSGDHVYASGTFNGWSASTLLTNNPSAANTNIYTATVDDTSDANGGAMDYKYVINSSYENTLDGNNRCAFLPTTSGSSLTLDLCTFADVGNPITNNIIFQVDMAQQINIGVFHPGSTGIYAQGSFEGWNDSFPLTNDPTIIRTNQFGLTSSNVYVGTYSWVAPIGGTAQYKFVLNNGGDSYESPAKGDPDNNNNRFFDQPGTNTNLVLPIVFFNDQPYAPLVTNAVTFQVDMSAQVLSGSFNPASAQVSVNGQFNNWSFGVDVLTNNPNASNPNLYTGIVLFTNGVGTPQSEQYKFVDNGGNYESLSPSTPQLGGNRFFTLADTATPTNATLPVAFFSDLFPSDLLPADTIVQFSVNMSNAMQFPSGPAFAEGSDSVYVNGDFIGWAPWSAALPQLAEGPPLIYQSDTNNSFFFFKKGSALVVNYKYSIDGSDNEARVNANHTRYIRSTGFYAMPTDTFGSVQAEQSFGNLAIGKPSGGQVPITWLGRPGVHLQVSSNLSSHVWVDHPETDSLSATNYPVGTTSLFFRLVHPPN